MSKEIISANFKKEYLLTLIIKNLIQRSSFDELCACVDKLESNDSKDIPIKSNNIPMTNYGIVSHLCKICGLNSVKSIINRLKERYSSNENIKHETSIYNDNSEFNVSNKYLNKDKEINNEIKTNNAVHIRLITPTICEENKDENNILRKDVENNRNDSGQENKHIIIGRKRKRSGELNNEMNDDEKDKLEIYSNKEFN